MSVFSYVLAGGEFATGHLARQSYLFNTLHERAPELELVLTSNDHPVARRWLDNSSLGGIAEVRTVENPAAALADTPTGAATVVDRLALDRGWLDALRGRENAVIFDDPRRLELDALRINALVPPQGDFDALTGTEYLILHPRVAELHATVDPHELGEGVLVSFGGSDPTGLTETVVGLLNEDPALLRGVETSVVVGGGKEAAEYRVERELELLSSPGDFHERLAACRAALIAGGLTCYETAALGTPFLGVARTDHEQRNLQRLEGACRIVEGRDNTEVNLRTALRTLDDLLGDERTLREMSERGYAQVDGKGAARVAELILDRI